MKTNISRLCMLLIGAGYDKKMLEDLIYFIKKSDAKSLTKEFENILNSIGHTKSTIMELPHKNFTSSNDIKSRIYKLLIIDSGLSINECLSMFEKNIKIMYPNRKMPAINSKKGFYSSMKALTNYFTESELLHIASKLRNQVVNDTNNENDNEWMLKE